MCSVSNEIVGTIYISKKRRVFADQSICKEIRAPFVWTSNSAARTAATAATAAATAAAAARVKHSNVRIACVVAVLYVNPNNIPVRGINVASSALHVH